MGVLGALSLCRASEVQGKHFDVSVIELYAPTVDADSEERNSFYEKVEAAMSQCNSQDVILVIGDLNETVGECTEAAIVGSRAGT